MKDKSITSVEVLHMTRCAYPTDISDRKWEILRPYIPEPSTTGNREYSMREVVNGVRYVLRTGGAWQNMPHDLPKWQSCYGYFRQWERERVFEIATDEMRKRLRKTLGRDEEPSLAILDGQSVATTEKGGSADMMETRESKEESGM